MLELSRHVKAMSKSEQVMESIIDSESTSHVSEEAPIDSFVQLPETESDCHQSDHVMEFHLKGVYPPFPLIEKK
jgi:hypothetical protein